MDAEMTKITEIRDGNSTSGNVILRAKRARKKMTF
jgi:hypothetical protein